MVHTVGSAYIRQLMAYGLHESTSQMSTSPTSELYEQHLLLQREYNNLSTYQAEKKILRTRPRYYEHGEKTGGLQYTIDPDLQATLYKHITTNKIQDTIQSIQSGKSPGDNGSPTEHHKAFLDKLIPIVKANSYSSNIPRAFNCLSVFRTPLKPTSPTSILGVTPMEVQATNAQKKSNNLQQPHSAEVKPYYMEM